MAFICIGPITGYSHNQYVTYQLISQALSIVLFILIMIYKFIISFMNV